MKCPMCGKEVDQVHEHEIDGEKIPVYECSQCDVRFASEDAVKKLADDVQERVERILHKDDVKIV